MKKTLKLVAIFAVVLLVAVVGGLSGYYLISKNQTFHIYDLRIVVPIEDAGTFVYVNHEKSYASMKNQNVYMTTAEENYIQIAVFAYTSTQSKEVEVTSSNPEVAKVIFEHNLCYINYLKAGTATIKASLGGVEDSITVVVNSQDAYDFTVYDHTYYGDYANYFKNKIRCYSDSIAYEYDYEAFSASGENAGDKLNNDLFIIDYNKQIFEKVYIDGINKKLVVQCKSGLTSNRTELINIQSYTQDSEINPSKNFGVEVDIVTYTPEFLQVVLSKTPDFDEGFVFMDTIVVSDDDLTAEKIEQNPDVLNSYLLYQKSESNLLANSEKSVYNTYFTDKVSKLYLKFRKVYTNGDIVYLNPLETKEQYNLRVSDESLIDVSTTKDYYILQLDQSYFGTNQTFDISIDLQVLDTKYFYNLSHTFKFEFANLSDENIPLFYDYNSERGIYTYKYWDMRTYYNNEVYDSFGNVVGFY